MKIKRFFAAAMAIAMSFGTVQTASYYSPVSFTAVAENSAGTGKAASDEKNAPAATTTTTSSDVILLPVIPIPVSSVTTSSAATTTTKKPTTTATTSAVTTTTTATTSSNAARFFGSVFFNDPEKTEYNVGETVNYEDAKFHYYAEYESGAVHTLGGKEHYLSDIADDVFSEEYVLGTLDGNSETYVVTFDRSKVDTSKAGTYAVIVRLTNKDGSEVYGHDSFDIVVVVSGARSPGDMNGDGNIDAIDASKILSLYAMGSTNQLEYTEDDYKYCDVNKDGDINAVDASRILAYYAYTATNGDKSLKDFLKQNYV
ncbi:dockerin type I domain-containing protein [uncultured Ruminococcus sp.]|uniref:dockerin type I domain-containing protein n=1 Tax=uncultured Ruminococcus sp. TaxID=165186 RepID=UPI0026390C30|nr:dockerin type I domain-containing protein [uncultured Ruminococcus sp.]